MGAHIFDFVRHLFVAVVNSGQINQGQVNLPLAVDGKMNRDIDNFLGMLLREHIRQPRNFSLNLVQTLKYSLRLLVFVFSAYCGVVDFTGIRWQTFSELENQRSSRHTGGSLRQVDLTDAFKHGRFATRLVTNDHNSRNLDVVDAVCKVFTCPVKDLEDGPDLAVHAL